MLWGHIKIHGKSSRLKISHISIFITGNMYVLKVMYHTMNRCVNDNLADILHKTKKYLQKLDCAITQPT